MIIDLHSDLLSYLRMGPHRTPDDKISRSSLSQLKKGDVSLQTLAIFTQTKQGSTQVAEEQMNLFEKMTKEYFHTCAPFTSSFFESRQVPVHFIPAFENASGFAEEGESINVCLERLKKIHERLKHILYIGMTWDGENRFGGGVGSSAGLKEDGKRLLDLMAERGIPIDFSHASDKLAEGILNHIDEKNLSMGILASHSNFREIQPFERNLPEWLAREIIRRKGLIGIVLFAPFIHKSDPTALVRHVEYALSLSAEESLAFGADFFCDSDFPSLTQKYQTHTPFFDIYGDSSCYGTVLDLLKKKLDIKEDLLRNIASLNATRFFKKNINK